MANMDTVSDDNYRVEELKAAVSISSDAPLGKKVVYTSQHEINSWVKEVGSDTEIGVAAAPTNSATRESTPTKSDSQQDNLPQPQDRLKTSSPCAGSDDNSGHGIDSALLSALKDGRERRMLLRLEQMLVEFVQDSTRSFLDVGPAGNSQPPNTIFTTNTAAAISSSSPLLHNPPKVHNNFQRLILHRLADRFDIMRENIAIPSNEPSATFMVNPMQQNPCVIRLVKTAQTKIPKQLLIDMLDEIKQDSGADHFDTRNLSQALMQDAGSEGLSSIERRVSSGTAEITPRVVGRKMKIMKRAETGGPGLSNQKKTSSSSRKSQLRGKNLSDKEKAYAEARARIFAEAQKKNDDEFPSTVDDTVVNDENLTRRHLLQKTNSASTLASGNGSTHDSSSSLQDLSGSEKSSPIPGTKNEPELLIQDNTEQDVATPLPVHRYVSSNSPAASFSEDDRQQTSQTSSSENKNRKSSGSNNKAPSSKVTWRNRREEENDPDFRRGHGVVSVAAPTSRLPLHHSQHGIPTTYSLSAPLPASPNYGGAPISPAIVAGGGTAFTGHGASAGRGMYSGQPHQSYYDPRTFGAPYGQQQPSQGYCNAPQYYNSASNYSNNTYRAGYGAAAAGSKFVPQQQGQRHSWTLTDQPKVPHVQTNVQQTKVEPIPSQSSKLYNSEFPALG